uniref:glucuronosyltransferase n=1 Tax=Heterorhabditis bacteriophora TaxID=37862 RepID=A0A1I7XRU5_HETBA
MIRIAALPTAAPIGHIHSHIETLEEQTKRMWRSADAVCFDVDSTVCQDEAIDELAKYLGVGEAVANVTRSAMNGNARFREALAARLEVMRPSYDQLEQYAIVTKPKLTPGIQNLINTLHKRGTDVYLVSGGFRRLILPVADILGIDRKRIYANEILFDTHKNYAGFDINEPTSDSGSKDVSKKHNYKQIVMVGDGATDAEACPPADAFIGFGGNQTVLMPVLDPDLVNKTGLRLTKKLIKVHTDPRTEALMESKANSPKDVLQFRIFLNISDPLPTTTLFLRFIFYSFESANFLGLQKFFVKPPIKSAGSDQNYLPDRELLAQASYVFTNSNPYLDYPHPTIHKSIGIGGIAVDIGNANANQLSQEWDTILNQRKINVLVSFGSVAKSVYMPDNYKQSLLSVFSSLPFITFIWKYEDEGASIVNHVPNVHLSTWVPQNSLLADPRLSLFITHGGLGSTTELAHMGKPAVMVTIYSKESVPLFADQMRNANMLARHGGAIVLTKYDLGHPEKIRTAIEMAIKEPKYYTYNEITIPIYLH